jgi:hypothetical protein
MLNQIPNPAIDRGLETDISIRIGCRIEYFVPVETHAYFMMRPRRFPTQRLERQLLSFDPGLHSTEDLDSHGSLLDRIELKPGVNTIGYDAIVSVPAIPERLPTDEPLVALDRLPGPVLRYTLPSRYCDSDKLMAFAAEHFGSCQPGGPTVRAICDWLHRNIEYRAGSVTSQLTASDIIPMGYGVCRDFAHCAVALCRCFNIPARYVSGILPDIGVIPEPTSMDFHAFFEVFLGGEWITMDARFNTARIGRVKIAAGLDAVDGAFATIYGSATLNSLQVWAYQIDPDEVSIGDPVDLTKRLCGRTEVLRPTRKIQR